MIDIIITSITIIIIMLAFIIIVLKNVVKRINQNAREFFINKLDDYNYIVEEKEKQISELTAQIEALEKNKKNMQSHEIQEINNRNVVEEKIIRSIKVPKYREENFFNNYKELKNKFDFDKEDLIKKFIMENQNKKDERDYKTLVNFRNKFDKDTIYQLMTLTSKEQFDIIQSVLNDREKALIDLNILYPNEERFNTIELIDTINKLMIEKNPTIHVYVSKYDKNYDYIDPNIKTEHYKSMSEGLIIEFKGKKYDYSI